MESSPTRVLVVANKTAATEPLLDAVRARAARGPCTFTLLVPTPVSAVQKMLNPDDADREQAAAVLEQALPLLSEAAGSPVAGRIGVPEPLSAIQDAVNLVGFDEIIISTLPHRVSRWLHLDLPRKAAGLGLPVTTVTAGTHDQAPTRQPTHA
jgi:hypothetical protein